MWEALFTSIDVDDYDMPILCLVTRHDKINEDNMVWLLKCDTELRPVMKSTINVTNHVTQKKFLQILHNFP